MIDPKERFSLLQDIKKNYRRLDAQQVQIATQNDPSLLEQLQAALTPTERARLFPDYYKDQVPVDTGLSKQSGGGGGVVDAARTAVDRIFQPGKYVYDQAQRYVPSAPSTSPSTSPSPSTPAQTGGQTAVTTQPGRPGPRTASEEANDNQKAIVDLANEIGIDPVDLATIISLETGGKFSTTIKGGKGGNYQGLIQFGPNERRKYGYDPNQSFAEQVKGPVRNYLLDRGLKKWVENNPDATLDEIRTATYSTINAGRPEKKYWGRSDGHRGSVADKVQYAFQEGKKGQTHRGNALAFMEGGLKKDEEPQIATASLGGDSSPSAVPTESSPVADGTALVKPVGESISGTYESLRKEFPDTITADSPIWNRIDPELAKYKKQILDADTGAVHRDVLLSADASSKVLRQQGLLPRVASGGDNHSANHGRGRKYNTSIDLAAKTPDGKNIRIGDGGLPPQVKLDMARAAQLAGGTNFRLGFPDQNVHYSMHIQRDPERKTAAWAYTNNKATTSSVRGFSTTDDPTARAAYEQFNEINKMGSDQRMAALDQMLGGDQVQVASTPQPVEMKSYTVNPEYAGQVGSIRKQAEEMGVKFNDDGTISMSEETKTKVAQQYGNVISLDNIITPVQQAQPEVNEHAPHRADDIPASHPLSPNRRRTKPVESTQTEPVRRQEPSIKPEPQQQAQKVSEAQPLAAPAVTQQPGQQVATAPKNVLKTEQVKMAQAQNPGVQSDARPPDKTLNSQMPQQIASRTSAPKSYVDAVKRSSGHGPERGYWNPIGGPALVG